MANSEPDPPRMVRDRPGLKRYELEYGGGLAFIDYRKSAGVVSMVHAEVPPQFGGRGVGTALVRGALELARSAGLKVQPLCPFVAAVMRRYPEYGDLYAPD